MTSADVEIAECIESRTSFLLDAGAGSGKTYSLVMALRLILKTRRKQLAANGQSVACITFTNVAKDEITERIAHDPVVGVSTIHEFLWSLIRPHQRELTDAVRKYNLQLPAKSSRRKDAVALEVALRTVSISYSDRGSNLLEGRLHHDDLLSVAKIMFASNPMLSRLTSARYPYLLVDEYQDTSPAVVETILEHLLPTGVGGFVVGLFGDKMQSIYHTGEHAGIGEIPAQQARSLRRIVKEENRRCSRAVIRVLNNIRTDIQQVPSVGNLDGDAIYIQPGEGNTSGLGKAMSYLASRAGWTLSGAGFKQLYLTHRLIAQKSGYGALLELYAARSAFHRDQLIGGEDEVVTFFRDKVQPLVSAWVDGDHGRAVSLLHRNGGALQNNLAKRTIRAALDELSSAVRDRSVGAVLRHLRSTALFPMPDKLVFRLDNGQTDIEDADAETLEREAKARTFYAGLFALPYREFASFIEFSTKHTPYATKHGVKGAEFETVVVILDDEGANWNLYSFGKYLSGDDLPKNAKRWERSRNVFYVCCSRAKRNLAVIDLTDRSVRKDAAVRALFGGKYAVFL